MFLLTLVTNYDFVSMCVCNLNDSLLFISAADDSFCLHLLVMISYDVYSYSMHEGCVELKHMIQTRFTK